MLENLLNSVKQWVTTICTCADVKYSGVKIFLLKFGSLIRNVIKKSQVVQMIYKLNFYVVEAHPFPRLVRAGDGIFPNWFCKDEGKLLWEYRDGFCEG